MPSLRFSNARRIGGKSCKTIAAFSYDIGKRGTGILGQKGFFDHFSIKFELAKEQIEINPIRS